MTINQIVIFLLLLPVAAGVSAFFYSPRKEKLLFALRTVSLFFMLLFLFNPIYLLKRRETIKPQLFILADNTVSVKNYGDLIKKTVDSLFRNRDLLSKFNISVYYFDTILHKQSGTYAGETDIAAALKRLKEEKENEKAAVVLLTDGQSTVGNDYRYILSPADRMQVFPVVTGDTAQFPDLRIDRVDYNRRVGLGNDFIIRPYVAYDRPEGKIKTKIIVKNGKYKLFEKYMEFDKEHAYRSLQIRLKAEKPGWQTLTVEAVPFAMEKIKSNNRRTIHIKVEEQSAHILILTGKIHPDVGALRRVLSRIKTYKVELDSVIRQGKKYDLIIAIQPGRRQCEALTERKEAIWYITGHFTDWMALNRWNGLFGKKLSYNGLKEQYLAIYNPAFDLFQLPSFEAEQHPALKDVYGEIYLKEPGKILFYAKIKNIKTGQPLTVYFPERYVAATFGSGLWRWLLLEKKRNKSGNFTEQWIEKTVTYLLRKPGKNLLILDYRERYPSGKPVKIRLQAYNTLWEENRQARLRLILTDSTGKRQNLKLYYNNPYFETQVSGLTPGRYTFTAVYDDYQIAKQGMFIVLPPKREQPDIAQTEKLTQLADYTGGKVFYQGQAKTLAEYLKNSPDLKGKIRLIKQKKHLTDQYIWLLIAVLFLSMEWFYRKYRGI